MASAPLSYPPEGRNGLKTAAKPAGAQSSNFSLRIGPGHLATPIPAPNSNIRLAYTRKSAEEHRATQSCETPTPVDAWRETRPIENPATDQRNLTHRPYQLRCQPEFPS